MPANGGGGTSRLTRVMPPHYLHELPAQDEERLAQIFQRLDLDGNGRVDVRDLSAALREVGVHSQYAQVHANIIISIFIVVAASMVKRNTTV